MIWKQEGRCVCKTGMKYLEQEIFGLSEAFFKPHRCFLINLERVEKIGKKDVQPGQVLVFCGLAAGAEGFVFWNGIVTSVFLLLLARERGCLRLWCGLLLAAVYGLLRLFAEYFKASGGMETEKIMWNLQESQELLLCGVLLLEVLLFFALESTLYSYQRRYEAQAESFQQDILSHQYTEMKEIYLNMRGWRHDYHNHMQVMKVQLAKGRIKELGRYLDALEQDLDSVDASVKATRWLMRF